MRKCIKQWWYEVEGVNANGHSIIIKGWINTIHQFNKNVNFQKATELLSTVSPKGSLWVEQRDDGIHGGFSLSPDTVSALPFLIAKADISGSGKEGETGNWTMVSSVRRKYDDPLAKRQLLGY